MHVFLTILIHQCLANGLVAVHGIATFICFFLCVCVFFYELVYYQLLCYLCTYNKYTVNAMNNLQFVTFQEVI